MPGQFCSCTHGKPHLLLIFRKLFKGTIKHSMYLHNILKRPKEKEKRKQIELHEFVTLYIKSQPHCCASEI